MFNTRDSVQVGLRRHASTNKYRLSTLDTMQKIGVWEWVHWVVT